METPHKPALDKRLFWDIRFEELDYEKYANFVIEPELTALAHFSKMPAAGIERIARLSLRKRL
jgi:hypothetical protein